MILTIILSVVIMALFPAGYILGSKSTEAEIRRLHDYNVDLQAQNDGLQTRMLTMLDETIKGGAR
jgi:hypothetical protein